VRNTWSVLVPVLAGLMLAGCPVSLTDRLDYRIGVARIGDDHHLFAPLCPGDRVSGVKVGESPYTWWSASGPKDPADGPAEFVVLGDDSPFHHVTVRAGGNVLAPALPAEFRATVDYADGYGSGLHKSITLRLAAVPVYPAGTDPRQVRYLTRPLGDMGDLAGPEEIRSHSDCAGGGEIPLRQTADSMRSGAAERVGAAMLDQSAVNWLAPVPLDVPDSEDVAAHVCGNGPGFGALVAAFGQERLWQEPEFDVDTGGEVRQFTGAYGRITAAEAIGQVEGRLGCERYTDFMTEYTEVRRVALGAIGGIDRQLLYCEESEHGAGRCTLLLAKGDVLTRVVVQGAGVEQATVAARALADDTAAALAG
jgi:hypothetical protein